MTTNDFLFLRGQMNDKGGKGINRLVASGR